MIVRFVLDNESKIKGKILFSYFPYNFYRFLKVMPYQQFPDTHIPVFNRCIEVILPIKIPRNGLLRVIPRQIIRERIKA